MTTTIADSNPDRDQAVGVPSRDQEEHFNDAVLAGGAWVTAVFAAGSVALASLGLAGLWPRVFTALAGIGVGIAVFVAGAALGSRWNRETTHIRGVLMKRALLGGVGADVQGGAACIALASIGLAGYAPHVMLAVAAIVNGVTLLVGGATLPAVARLVRNRKRSFDWLRERAMDVTGGLVVLSAAASTVLGIIALATASSYVLVGVAMLAVAIALLLAGLAEAARFGHHLRHG